MAARMHEHMGMERYERGPVRHSVEERMEEAMHPGMHKKMRAMMHRKYDVLRHERDEFNDEYRHDAEPVKAGLYNYDRQRPSDISEYRRYKEMTEAGMIHEDPRAVANLPQEVRYEAYEKSGGYLPEDLDDTMRGIDRQMGYDNMKKMNHFYPKKV